VAAAEKDFCEKMVSRVLVNVLTKRSKDWLAAEE
jgi:hypothetical protein